MVLVFRGWSGVFWTIFFKWVLLFHLFFPVPGMLKPSEPQWTVTETHFPSHHSLFFLQQNLEWDASSCWWSLKLLSISHRGKYIYIFFNFFCIAVQFPVCSFQWNSPEWCSCWSKRGTDFVLLNCIYWSPLLHSPFWIQLICDVVKSSGSQTPVITS